MPANKFALSQGEIADFCKRNRIRKLSLFGSATRDDFRPDSDVDILAEFEPEAKVGFFKLYVLNRNSLLFLTAGALISILPIH